MRFFSKFFLTTTLLLASITISNGNPVKFNIASTTVLPYSSPPSSTYYLQGNELSGDGTTILGSFNTPLCINNCNVVGSTFNLTGQFSSGDPSLAPLGYLGRITYLGNNYVVTTSSFSYITGETNILQPIINLPDNNYTTATTTFSMTGILSLRSLSTTVPNAILQLTGSGIASIDYVYNPYHTGLDIGFIRYRYNNAEGKFTSEPTPEPTPEPATLLLFGTGIAGVIGYTRRRRKSGLTK